MDMTFQIGPFPFRLLGPEGFPLPETLRLFQRPGLTPNYCYSITETVQFPQPNGGIVARRPDLLVFQDNHLESRLIATPTSRQVYALYREAGPDRAEISLAPGSRELMRFETFFCSLLALERRMIGLDQLVLHCAYVRYQGTAILFSAPSETGKTTQANLWAKYRGAETVNGDRALLGRVNDRWTAQGWPVCGSSGVCALGSTPIRAIVMLSQAKENTVRRLDTIEAMRLVFGQVTVNRWNPVFTQQATDLVLALCGDVPVYHLGCTISEEAVTCLEKALES